MRAQNFRIPLAALSVLALGAHPSPTLAQQQQYANAYAHWNFGADIVDITNVDQTIWIAKPAPASQWVMLWKWTADPAHGGYFGFNTDAAGNAQALFSLWNADAATGDHCKEFGGEGEGWSCRMPLSLRADIAYRLRLDRTRIEPEGVWWGGWITEVTAAETPKEFYLGEIRVKPEMHSIRGNTIENFSEYYGDVVAECKAVPFSLFAVAPPAGNRAPDGDGYARLSRANGSTNARSNPCQSGSESQGALFKVESFDFAGMNGAMIFFGGARSTHTLPAGLIVPDGK
jgi:hypothetical protein